MSFGYEWEPGKWCWIIHLMSGRGAYTKWTFLDLIWLYFFPIHENTIVNTTTRVTIIPIWFERIYLAILYFFIFLKARSFLDVIKAYYIVHNLNRHVILKSIESKLQSYVQQCVYSLKQIINFIYNTYLHC